MNLMSFKNHLYLTFVYFEQKLRFSHTEIECREIELVNKMFTMKSVLNPVLWAPWVKAETQPQNV